MIASNRKNITVKLYAAGPMLRATTVSLLAILLAGCGWIDWGPPCDSAYPTVCIPPPPPDLNCADIEHTDFTVLEPDPHGFDGDGDGIGCET